MAIALVMPFWILDETIQNFYTASKFTYVFFLMSTNWNGVYQLENAATLTDDT